MVKNERPVGIAIIAVLIMISGVLWILAGDMILRGIAGLAAEIENILGLGAARLFGTIGFIILLLVFLEGLGLWKLNIIALVSLGLNVFGILLNSSIS